MKKLFCAVLSCCLLLGAFPVSAANGADTQMQRALTFVKSKIDIPSELDKFSYEKQDSETYGGKTAWSFTWTDENRTASLDVETVADEQIMYYQYSDRTDKDQNTIGKVTKAQGEQNARAFLERVLPASISSAADMLLTNADNISYEWRYTFVHTVDSVPVTDHVVYVEVNKETGEVTWYCGFYENGNVYPDHANGAVSIEAARDIFANQIGIRLVYRSYYDAAQKTLQVFPAYILDTQGKMVMADGSVRQVSALRSSATNGAMAEAGGVSTDLSSSAVDFSPQELAQIQQSKHLLTKEQAVQKVTSAFADSKTATLKSATLTQDAVTKGQYLWNLNFTKEGQYLFASVDAASGEILSYNIYGSEKNGTPVSEENAKKALDSLLTSLCGDKLAQCRLQSAAPRTGTKAENTVCTVQYVRQANGIDYENNTITATLNLSTGKVTSYRCTWYPDAVFPSVDKVKSEKDMLALLFDKLTYSKVYRDLDGAKYFGYDFPEITNAMFDPFSGERIGYNGKPLNAEEKPHYTDIDSHWCCDMALTLLENDVYFPGGKLRADSTVTQEDFLRLLYQSQQFYAADDRDAFYQNAVRRGIVTESDIRPDGTVSRAEAARYIIRIMGLEKAATLDGIYVSPFSDSVTPNDLGYAALCYGFGIINGDANGNFNADASVTRAEAISMVYHAMLI